jgi:hypothetical protein
MYQESWVAMTTVFESAVDSPEEQPDAVRARTTAPAAAALSLVRDMPEISFDFLRRY